MAYSSCSVFTLAGNLVLAMRFSYFSNRLATGGIKID